MKREIISRRRWRARHDRGFRDAPLPAREVWLHHSVTIAPDLEFLDPNRDGVDDDEARAMRTLEDIGEQRFGGGISYTFAVMPSGRVYEGHGVDREGAHTKGRNSIARAIVLVGNYEAMRMTEAQIVSVAWLLQKGDREGWWREPRLNGGHRQAPGASTACPGRYAMASIGKINKLASGKRIPDTDAPIKKVEEDYDMSVAYVHGDSNVKIPNSNYTWGDIVFLIEWDVQEGISRARVVNGQDPGYRMWRALGRPVKRVPQDVLDSFIGTKITDADAAKVAITIEED